MCMRFYEGPEEAQGYPAVLQADTGLYAGYK